jgi:hypothetical protein
MQRACGIVAPAIFSKLIDINTILRVRYDFDAKASSLLV